MAHDTKWTKGKNKKGEIRGKPGWKNAMASWRRVSTEMGKNA